MFKQNRNRDCSQTTLAEFLPPLKSFSAFRCFFAFFAENIFPSLLLDMYPRTRASLFRTRKKDEPRVSQPVA